METEIIREVIEQEKIAKNKVSEAQETIDNRLKTEFFKFEKKKIDSLIKSKNRNNDIVRQKEQELIQILKVKEKKIDKKLKEYDSFSNEVINEVVDDIVGLFI